jgi:hypothetical protein
MPTSPRLSWDQDPLALDPDWDSPVPLTPLREALEQTVFRSGLSREDWLRRLASQLHKPALLPLLWLLPRGWRLAPAQLPPKLQSLGTVLEQGLLSPALLAALVDDLAHVLPADGGKPTALERWCRSQSRITAEDVPIPASAEALEALLAMARGSEDPACRSDGERPTIPAPAKQEALLGGLLWRNLGLAYSQAAGRRRANSLLAQLLNRLAANRLDRAPGWWFEDCSSGRQWIDWLEQRSWRISGRLRASVASFGLGACMADQGPAPVGWRQIPLGLPLRTGLVDEQGEESLALLPHAALELRLDNDRGDAVQLQYYQGNEGLCGWEGLNDLHRPWQNDSSNGTVRYLGETFSGERLRQLIDLTEVMALVHNSLASTHRLRHGGYGTLGFCIDTTALLQQAMTDGCDLFPVLLSGIWRERLLREARRLGVEHERYTAALMALPLDLSHHGPAAGDAWRRLRACQPGNSPFRLVQRHRSSAGISPG